MILFLNQYEINVPFQWNVEMRRKWRILIVIEISSWIKRDFGKNEDFSDDSTKLFPRSLFIEFNEHNLLQYSLNEQFWKIMGILSDFQSLFPA